MRALFLRIAVPLVVLGTVGVIAEAERGAGEKSAGIRLEEIGGRTWLVDGEGRPFFAHGVTHMGGKHGEDVKAVGKAVRELGFNAYGYGCPKVLKGELPYLEGRQFVPMSTYRVTDKSFGFVDVFDEEVKKALRAQVRKSCLENRENPNLIGYCWTDLGAWPLENSTGTNWVEFVRGLPEESAGKKAYGKFLKTWKGGEGKARDLAFLRIIAREYFRVLGETNRRLDPDHLIFGDRLTFQTAIPEVVEEMLPYVDGIAVQPSFRAGFPKKEFERLHKMSGKPIIICDFAIRFAEEGKKIRGWKPEESPKAAGERYSEYIKEAFATPYVVGAFWCNPINSKPGFNKQGIKQGLFDVGMTPRPELHEAIRELNEFLVEKMPKG